MYNTLNTTLAAAGSLFDTHRKVHVMFWRIISLTIVTLIFSACNLTTAPHVTVDQAWVKQAKVSEITAGDLNQTCICERVTSTNAYLEVTNWGLTADRLTHVKTDAAIKVELRQAGAAQVLSSPLVLDGVDIPPAGGKATFAQGSFAMVLKDLRGDLKPGDKVHLSLFFEKAGQVDIVADVR